MHKWIVTTTIQPPTKATLLFCKNTEWNFVIIGDLKTPHEAYRELEKKYPQVVYLDPEYQEKHYRALSDSIGWKNIQRRNIGFVFAYQKGADIVATVDDDNIPYDNWGKNIYIGKTISLTCYQPENGVFDPLAVTKSNYVWHRGYPIQLLSSRTKIKKIAKVKRRVLVQADLWNGDPDIDAIARLTYMPLVRYDDIKLPYCSNRISPFNSQNTFIAREALPYYAVLPHVGRMDDIWGGYILQYKFPHSLIYTPPSVYQDRNKQDLITNLENEVFGYRHTLGLLTHLSSYKKYLPDATIRFYEIYRHLFGSS